ncbi:MAG TPA: acyltransferase family protein [Gemmatimonadaceae bacterium]|nr:acyltransferase family protein [Gemmatimonadaceae bacterium]
MAGQQPTFRPDIEGLRGVAILLVVLFHARVPALAGGFVGVDVFFVLSGFFITGLLVRERETTGDVGLNEFYGRRALRLLPALLVVLLATLAIVFSLYAPIDRPRVAGTARAVALHAGNVEFARGALDYFGSTSHPLLHTWSLAVEEQFYLVWPLLLVVIVPLLLRDDADSAAMRRTATRAVAVVGVASLVASLVVTRTSQPWAFFGMPTRIWEFALGGLLSLVLVDDGGRSLRGATLLQALGLAAIGVAVASFDRSTPYPGAAALLPALGACALIAGGARTPEGPVTRALSAQPLRWLGRVSYAWYLWHWPLVGLGEVLDPALGVRGRLMWTALALVLAWLTYRFVERPARGGGLSRIPDRWIAPAALAASVVAALLAHGAMRVAQHRVATTEQRAFAQARGDRMTHRCWANTVEDARTPCLLGDRSATTTIALLGDSHAEHWTAGLDRAGRENGWRVDVMVKGGCPVLDMTEVGVGRSARYYGECVRYHEAMMRRIIAMRPAAVVLSSWDHYIPPNGTSEEWQLSVATWERGLRRTYARLAAAGIHTIVLRDVPRTGFDVPACLSRRAARLPLARACTYERATSVSGVAVAAQDRAARGLPVRIVDMNDQVCDTPRCRVVRNGSIVFTDDNHLTASFSRSLATVLGQRIAAAIDAPGNSALLAQR